MSVKTKFTKISLKEELSALTDEPSVHSHSEIDHHNNHHFDHDHEINPFITPILMHPLVYPNRSHEYFKHLHTRALSPTPVDSRVSIESHSVMQPLKGTSSFDLFVNHPTQSFTSKQLCDYIEMIVLRHAHQSHEIHLDKSIQSIRETLSKLRSLLIIEHDTIDVNMIPKHHLSRIGEIPKSPMVYNIKPTNSNKNVNEISLNDNKPKLTKKNTKWCTHSRRNLWDTFLLSSDLIHHPDYSIPSDKYCGVLKGSVRQDWNTVLSEDNWNEEQNWEDLKPHWFELFFDLMFVAAIVHISIEVADAYKHYDYMFIITVFPQFGLLILCWLEQALYHSRFRMTQIGDGFLRFVYMGFVLLMGLSIQTSHKLFLTAYMFTKLMMCIMFMKSLLIPRAVNHSIYMIIENVLNIISVIFVEIFIYS
eukprot:121083_1